MANPGSLASLMPMGEDSFVRAQRDLERRQQEEAAARGLGASTIGTGGELLVQGSLRVTGSITVPGTLASAGAVTAGTNVTAGGQIVAGTSLFATTDVVASTGTVYGNAGITSAGAYALDVSTLPGGRAAAWIHNTGRFGQTVSSILKKMDLEETPFTAADFLACMPYVFHYIAQADIRNNQDNPYYDPDYVVPWDVGFMAEHLIANHLELFVFYKEDGSVGGIHYAEFGAIATIVIGRDHENRLRALEGRPAETFPDPEV